MINIEKVSEGIHYELIVPEGVENEQAWDVRILEGDFVETIIRFGNVALNGKENCLNFNFRIIYSPDSNLSTDYEPLQLFAGDILEDILEQAIAEGTVALKDIDDN